MHGQSPGYGFHLFRYSLLVAFGNNAGHKQVARQPFSIGFSFTARGRAI